MVILKTENILTKILNILWLYSDRQIFNNGQSLMAVKDMCALPLMSLLFNSLRSHLALSSIERLSCSYQRSYKNVKIVNFKANKNNKNENE